MSTKIKLENIDQMFENAYATHILRDALPFPTHCAVLLWPCELLKLRGGSATEKRASACYASKIPVTGAKWGGRRRKAGGRERLYGDVLEADGVFPMPEMQGFAENLRRAVKVEYLGARGFDTFDEPASEDPDTEETSERLEKIDKRNHRRSLIGLPAQLDAGVL
ncbi:hypothetical protein N7493_010098 [Penicillium malachiteum]|uniref:Uncharacterized protein n=1 Tax=Penicillium malachiteum TaxID=1324776 RepID=A0AAD6MS75_9EURO|nr:hypothetical protein N7493_010098 [Penicillium malachiteum]